MGTNFLKPTIERNRADYYYIRLSFTNGVAAWIDPIWVQTS
ncbi:MAG: hypothetical protein ACTSXH_19430 [Promethearchaeota archaeon]